MDDVYITGEEAGSDGILFALDVASGDLYALSGVTGDNGRGVGGMPTDSWENAALLDTGEGGHVALLLSPDGGTAQMKMCVGEKGLDAAASSFTLESVADDIGGAGELDDADNVDWTDATTLGGVTFDQGLLLVNEDNGDGEVWVMNVDGTGRTLIADTADFGFTTETSGILDISGLLGYVPGSIILTDAQGPGSTLSVLINPQAALGLLGGTGLLLIRRRRA